ncbi:MAG: cytochrome P450, partial [Sphingomonadales bacterium]
FLDRLLRIPGLRLERAPDVGWNPLVAGYELRNCRLVVDPV